MAQHDKVGRLKIRNAQTPTLLKLQKPLFVVSVGTPGGLIGIYDEGNDDRVTRARDSVTDQLQSLNFLARHSRTSF